MSETFTPPAGVAEAAKRALGWISDGHAGGGFTSTGRTRAGQLSRREGISRDTIMRMVSFFARHEVDKKAEGFNQGEKGFPSPGRVAWDAWGGDAGKSWAESVASKFDKEKSTMADFTNSYAAIIKQEKQDDGSLLVYGKATDDSLDIDQQICDDAWLSSAMPEWFKSGGNIREQHSSIAAGVAKEYESKPDGHYISVLVVDPVSVKKVESGVLKGFSIGIKSPRVVRDQKAANGRIIDGQIVEVSLVDRPANPNAKLMLAKSVEGEVNLVKVEEFIEKGNENHDERGRFSSGDGGGRSGQGPEQGGKDWQPSGSEHGAELGKIQDNITQAYSQAFMKDRVEGQPMSARVMDIAQAKDDAQGHLQDAHSNLLGGNNSAAAESMRSAASVLTDGTGKTFSSAASALNALADKVEGKTKSAKTTKKDKSMLADVIKEIFADSKKFDQASYDLARRGIAQLIISEASEIADSDSDERDDIDTLLSALKHLFSFRDGELDEDNEAALGGSLLNLAAKGDDMDEDGSAGCDCDGCVACQKDGGCDDKICKGCTKMSMKFVGKCLECGCGQVGDNHGKTTVQIAGNNGGISTTSNVSTATIITPEQNAGSIKSAEGEDAPAETPAEDLVEDAKADEATEEVVETEILDEKSVTAIIEKAVKSATDSVRAEIAELQSAKKAVEDKAMALESELVIAKSAAVAGGPKRTGRVAVTDSNELLIKAAEYRLKASATSDPILVKGYKALEKEYLEKAGEVVSEDN